MSPLSTLSQQGYHVQTVKPLTFILQLPNSSVRCNCASHQPDSRKLCCNPPEIQTERLNVRVFHQKDANGIANSDYTDQTAPLVHSDLDLHCLPRPVYPKT